MKLGSKQPTAAEKGRMISELARQGITGVTLAAIAGKTRKEIAALVAARILEQKGVVRD